MVLIILIFFIYKIIIIFDGGWVVTFFLLKKIMAIYDGGWVVRLFFTTKIPKYTSKIRPIMPQKMRGKFYVIIVRCMVL